MIKMILLLCVFSFISANACVTTNKENNTYSVDTNGSIKNMD